MDRILLEVDDVVAKNWHSASDDTKKQLNATVSQLLKKALTKKGDDFWQFIEKVGKQAQAKGLTEEKLNELLNEN